MDPGILDVGFLEEVWRIARRAGRRTLDFHGDSQLEVGHKSDLSPVTAADLESQKLILEGLRDLAPEIPCLSEEDENQPSDDRRGQRLLWVVDPLDGTKEFVAGRDEFTVNIALVENGEPVLGVVDAPALGRSYLGLAGVGAWRTEGDLRSEIRAEGTAEDELVVVASRSHRGAALEAYLGNLPAHRLTSIGSSLKFCLVAEGAADFYPRLSPTMEWDVAAAHAVLRAAGGDVLVLETGEPLRYDREQLRNPHFVALGLRPIPWRPAQARCVVA